MEERRDLSPDTLVADTQDGLPGYTLPIDYEPPVGATLPPVLDMLLIKPAQLENLSPQLPKMR
ncbi:hypothetical protein N7492_006912 [Penicillium capsulatum]|uniref:Uncharacterized protein n=1 Tax=Penicillium capsulatum TaxID=69766 RepID=A0A9W9I2I4_9EURO|nr:hypothetical protein N7492_006912 [Penicillium capsulatum]